MLPYTQEVLLGVVAFYQREWWWLLLLFYPALCVPMFWGRNARAELGVLAICWSVCGGLFFAARFSDYDFVARYEAALFFLQALALALSAFFVGRRARVTQSTLARRIGNLLFAMGLLGLPLVDGVALLISGAVPGNLWFSIRWPGLTPWFTVVLTLGVLLRRHGLWFLWPLPVLWIAKATLVAYWLDMPRDFSLLVLAMLALTVGVIAHRRSALSD